MIEEAVAYGEVYDKPWIIIYRRCSGGCVASGHVFRLCLGLEGVYGLEHVGYAYLCPCSLLYSVEVERVVAVYTLGTLCFLVVDSELKGVGCGEGYRGDRLSWYYFAATSIEELAEEMLRLGAASAAAR